MNWLALIVFTIFFINVYQGYKKGFFRTVLSLVSWIFIIVIANVFASQLAQMIISETSTDEIMIQFINEKLIEMVETIAIEEQLPIALREVLLGNFGSFEEILQSDIFQTEELFIPYILKILQILCTIVLIIALRIVVIIADKILAFATNLPLIGQADKGLGVAVGCIKGLIFVWILMSAITFGILLNANLFDMSLIYDSPILIWLYENNPILNFIANF